MDPTKLFKLKWLRFLNTQIKISHFTSLGKLHINIPLFTGICTRRLDLEKVSNYSRRLFRSFNFFISIWNEILQVTCNFETLKSNLLKNRSNLFIWLGGYLCNGSKIKVMDQFWLSAIKWFDFFRFDDWIKVFFLCSFFLNCILLKKKRNLPGPKTVLSSCKNPQLARP